MVTNFRIVFLEAQGLADFAYEFADALLVDDMVGLLTVIESLVILGLERAQFKPS